MSRKSSGMHVWCALYVLNAFWSISWDLNLGNFYFALDDIVLVPNAVSPYVVRDLFGTF
jgi:hypothetical protein